MTRKAYGSGFKMRGNPFKRTDFGTFEEQKAKALQTYKEGEDKAMEGWNMAKEDYESGYSEGIRNIYHDNEEEEIIEPKKKKWYQRKPKGERNKKTWWNPFD